MAALVCDICGGKLVMGTGGIATCESCGMEHSSDRMKEKVQEVKGTVKIDNTHMIDNYLSMAENAYESSNLTEAESYCNKIIEIEPTNYKAWLYKGKSAGWQSTLQKIRFSESVSAFSKAIDNAPEDEKEAIVEETKEEIKRLSRAVVSLRAERFEKYPDEAETEGFSSDISSICQAMLQFVKQAGVMITVSEMMQPIAAQINQAVVAAWSSTISPDYVGNGGDKPSRYDWQRFIERVDFCITLVKTAVDLCDDDEEEDISRYENIIFLEKEAIDSCSYTKKYTEYGSYWAKEYSLTAEAKRLRKEHIKKCEEKIEEIKQQKIQKEKEEAERRIQEYWEEHKEEKEKLEKEKKKLSDDIEKFNKEKEAIPGWEKKKELQEKVNRLYDEKAEIGILKFKERKAKNIEINDAKQALESISVTVDEVEEKIDAKIAPLQERINEIDEELTKPR